MRGTRSTKASAPTTGDAPKSSSSTAKYTVTPATAATQKVFIFPSKASKTARIANLPHPRHGKPCRYLVCPETGIYEFTKVAVPKTTPRSWLIESASETPSAQTISDSDMFIATAIDPVFLILPALVESKASRSDGEDKKRLFLASDDYFDKLPEQSSHLAELLRCPQTRKRIEGRLAAVCDSVDAGDESMFRINEKKLADAIWAKAKRLAEAGSLPPSIEEKFVAKALEAPLLFQRRDMSSINGTSNLSAVSDSTVSTPRTEATDSQMSVTTDATAASQASTAATSVAEEPTNEVSSMLQASPEILGLQRIRVAFEFISSSYLPAGLASQLKEASSAAESAGVDFKPLDEYITKLNKLRSDAVAARSGSDYSRKRGYDEEEDEARQEKKRKIEEDKKRKASQSRGIKQLEKVNTSGMKKLSAFFTKK